MMLTTTTAAPCSRSSQRSAMAVSEAFLQSRHCRIACKGFLTLACCLVHLGPQQPLCVYVCVCVCERARARASFDSCVGLGRYGWGSGDSRTQWHASGA